MTRVEDRKWRCNRTRKKSLHVVDGHIREEEQQMGKNILYLLLTLLLLLSYLYLVVLETVEPPIIPKHYLIPE